MKTSPIINVSSAAASSAASVKAGGVSSSDQSFGHVLSREVNDRSNANSSADNSTASSTASATANGTTSSAATGKTKSGNDKTKSTTDTSAANATNATNTDASSNGSAQILALVANVQQTDSSAANTSTTSSADDASGSSTADALVGAVGSSSANTASALNNFQLAVADKSGAPNPNALPAEATADDAALAAAADGNSLPKPATELKDTKLANAATQLASSTTQTSDTSALTANAGSAQLAQPAADSTVDDAKAGAAGQAVLDLSTTAEKDIQAGLSALDANAAKATQPAPTIVPMTVPQQAMQGAQALPSNPSDKLTPPVGSAGWNQSLGQKVVWMVAGGQQSASLTLNPPDLGPLQVVLNVSNSHATATFTAAQPEVRQALESAMPKLREMLGDAGIQLGQTSVNSGSAQQQNASTGPGSQHSNSSRFSNAIDTGDTSIAAVTRTSPTSAGLGLVDTFA